MHLAGHRVAATRPGFGHDEDVHVTAPWEALRSHALGSTAAPDLCFRHRLEASMASMLDTVRRSAAVVVLGTALVAAYGIRWAFRVLGRS